MSPSSALINIYFSIRGIQHGKQKLQSTLAVFLTLLQLDNVVRVVYISILVSSHTNDVIYACT